MNKVQNAVQTDQLGKQYGSFWALKDCSITVPEGSISALVGPNGAGKTTLLKLLVGLNKPSAGSSMVLGKTPEQGVDFLSDVGYLAQEVPLYRQFSAQAHIAMGARLNSRWDAAYATKRLNDLRIPLDRSVAKLSGGQRAQVVLALALAKRPRLLLLDEPVAALDPLARVEFLSSLAQAVAEAEGSLTVLMSSHLLADLERVSDHVIILAEAKTQLCDSIDHVLQTHRLLVGPRTEERNDAYTVVQATHTGRQSTLMVRLNQPHFKDSHWQIHEPSIEEIVLAYMGQGQLEREMLVKGGTR